MIEVQRQGYYYTNADTMQVSKEHAVILYSKSGETLVIPFSDIKKVTAYARRITIDYKAASRLKYDGENAEIRKLMKDFRLANLKVNNRT